MKQNTDETTTGTSTVSQPSINRRTVLGGLAAGGLTAAAGPIGHAAATPVLQEGAGGQRLSSNHVEKNPDGATKFKTKEGDVILDLGLDEYNENVAKDGLVGVPAKFHFPGRAPIYSVTLDCGETEQFTDTITASVSWHASRSASVSAGWNGVSATIKKQVGVTVGKEHSISISKTFSAPEHIGKRYDVYREYVRRRFIVMSAEPREPHVEVLVYIPTGIYVEEMDLEVCEDNVKHGMLEWNDEKRGYADIGQYIGDYMDTLDSSDPIYASLNNASDCNQIVLTEAENEARTGEMLSGMACAIDSLKEAEQAGADTEWVQWAGTEIVKGARKLVEPQVNTHQTSEDNFFGHTWLSVDMHENKTIVWGAVSAKREESKAALTEGMEMLSTEEHSYMELTTVQDTMEKFRTAWDATQEVKGLRDAGMTEDSSEPSAGDTPSEGCTESNHPFRAVSCTDAVGDSLEYSVSGAEELEPNEEFTVDLDLGDGVQWYSVRLVNDETGEVVASRSASASDGQASEQFAVANSGTHTISVATLAGTKQQTITASESGASGGSEESGAGETDTSGNKSSAGDESSAEASGNESGDDGDSSDDNGPGFGIVSVLAGIGGAGYLLKQRVGAQEDDE